MKIEMRKITQVPKPFLLECNGLVLQGEIYREKQNIFRMEALLNGRLELICDHSGDIFLKDIHEPLVLRISDGVCNMQSQNFRLDDMDVIEFFDGFVDIEYILKSEIESIKSDYHIKDTLETGE